MGEGSAGSADGDSGLDGPLNHPKGMDGCVTNSKFAIGSEKDFEILGLEP